jgi:uncharacterized membrane protein
LFHYILKNILQCLVTIYLGLAVVHWLTQPVVFSWNMYYVLLYKMENSN